MAVRQESARGPANVLALRIGGGVLLLAVAYIHLALMFQVGLFNRLMGALFGLDVLLALGAFVGVLRDARWGWNLGMVAAGGAALTRLAMDLVPAFSRFLLGFGRPSGFRRFVLGTRVPGAFPHAFGSGHFPPGGLPGRGSVLPLPMPTGTLATVSIVLEILFAALAVAAILRLPKRA
ncbi:MAG: hypothetical protein K6V97_02720 [Actinomycetia bacterium]|nr:hypothetical protein [Actinomycetes bacterium]